MRLKEFLKDGGDVNTIDNQWNNMSIADRTNYIKGDLIKRGYTQNQTAAILGNLLQENRKLSTHTENPSSKALGIAQWLGGRKKAIISQGKHSTISGQLDFLDQEIKGKGAWTNNVGGKKAFFNSDDPRELTYIFRKDFERPGEHEANDNRRLANAFQVLGKAYTPTKYDSGTSISSDISMPSDMRPVDIKSELAKNPEMIQFFTPAVQSQLEESFKLDNEKQRQEQIESEYEFQNQQIQQALQEKQQQKEQILSMIPQSAFVGSGSQQTSLKLMQKGGKVVSELWKEKTGTDWSEAKRMGLTDGSYDKNIQLLSRLRNNDPELINAAPQEVVQQQQQTTQQPRLTFNDLPNNVIPDVNTDTEYYSWAKDKQAVTDSNTSLNQLEREGHVELIKGKDNKVKTDVNGNYLYKILTNEYKDTFNNWIKTLNTKDNSQPTERQAPVKKEEKPKGFLSSIQGLISDFANSTDQTLDEVGDTISEGASDVKDLFQQAYSYADRHFLDNTEVNTKKLVATKQPTVDASKPTHVFDDQINMTDIEVGKGKAASGIINLNSNKFVTRNRGDQSEVKGGKGIAVTLFNPMKKDIENSYKQFPEVMALKKDGSIEIMARDKVTKDKVESITRADRMPWDKLEVVEKNGKQYVKVEDSPDFKGKVVSMGGYNSGLGVGKWDKDYVPIDEANKYSKLIGGKVVMKSGDQEILVTGSFKDMYDAYKTLEKKTKQKPVVYKLDNGSFNTTYFKDNNMIDSEDLREHQNRNRAGGHALILLNK